MTNLSIGEVAQQVGVSTSTLRYYERVGLIPAPPRVQGQRRFSPEVLTRLSLIRMAQEAGLSIDEILTLLGGYPEETPPPLRWQDLAHRKIPEIDERIQRLQVVRQVLEESLKCDCLTLDACATQGWSTSSTR